MKRAKTIMMKNKSTQFDSLWKGVIEDFFPDFLRFFYPEADKYFKMDQFEFLDKELEKLYPARKTVSKRRFVYKLVKVHQLHGGEQWILIHIEVQGYRDSEFAERMFTYFYRIMDRYHHPVTAIAIFTGTNRNMPDHYHLETFGTTLDYRYNTYRIKDQLEEDLRKNGSPFALIVLAAKTALQSGKMTDEDLMTRHEWIIRALWAKKIPKEKINGIFAFLTRCLHFADTKNYSIFDQKIEHITQQKNVMGVVEILKQEGRDEERLKARKEILKARKEARKEAREEARKTALEEKKRLVRDLLAEENFTIAKIARLAKVSEAFVHKIKEELK